MTRYQAAVQFRGETFTGASHDDAFAQLARRFPRYRETSRKAEPISRGRKSPEGEFVGSDKMKKLLLVIGLGIALALTAPMRAEAPGVPADTIAQAAKVAVDLHLAAVDYEQGTLVEKNHVMAVELKAHADEIDAQIAEIRSQPVTGNPSDSQKKLVALRALRDFAKLDTQPPKPLVQKSAPAPPPSAHGRKAENFSAEIGEGYSNAARYVSAGEPNLRLAVDNIQLEHHSGNDSDQYWLGVLAARWLVIGKLATNPNSLNSEIAVSRARDFAKQSFHEMRQLQKKLGISDNLLFEAMGRGNDADAKRQLDLDERWD